MPYTVGTATQNTMPYTLGTATQYIHSGDSNTVGTATQYIHSGDTVYTQWGQQHITFCMVVVRSI